jgi:hypothetical protein
LTPPNNKFPPAGYNLPTPSYIKIITIVQFDIKIISSLTRILLKAKKEHTIFLVCFPVSSNDNTHPSHTKEEIYNGNEMKEKGNWKEKDKTGIQESKKRFWYMNESGVGNKENEGKAKSVRLGFIAPGMEIPVLLGTSRQSNHDLPSSYGHFLILRRCRTFSHPVPNRRSRADC